MSTERDAATIATEKDKAARKFGRSLLVEEGEFAGWRTPDRDTFDVRSGPFYHRVDEAGTMRVAFRVDKRHLNGLGIVHGGCLVTFADHALFMFAAREIAGQPSVTVSLNSEFVGGAREGDLIEATGDVVKAGRTMIFVRGLLKTGDKPLLNFSGTIMLLPPKQPPARAEAGID